MLLTLMGLPSLEAKCVDQTKHNKMATKFRLEAQTQKQLLRKMIIAGFLGYVPQHCGHSLVSLAGDENTCSLGIKKIVIMLMLDGCLHLS